MVNETAESVTHYETDKSLPLTEDANKLPRVISTEITKTGTKTVILVEKGVLSEAGSQAVLSYLGKYK